MRALLFPGQGSRIERDVAAWYPASGSVRALVDLACTSTGVPLEKMLARGGRALDRTELLEPVLTALTVGITIELEERGVRAGIVAGHSLGELTACYAAGCMTAEATVILAAERGRLMAREATRNPGGMIALMVRNRAIVEEALTLAREHGRADLAVHNAPDQWIISGDLPALRAIARKHPTTPIAVAGAWHSFAMAQCVAELREAVRAALTAPIAIPIVCNRTGRVVERAGDLPDLLALQLTHPVQWVEAMRTFAAAGVTECIVPGPGKALRALVRRNLGDTVSVRAVEIPAELEQPVGMPTT